jgi:hypothetical protein
MLHRATSYRFSVLRIERDGVAKSEYDLIEIGQGENISGLRVVAGYAGSAIQGEVRSSAERCSTTGSHHRQSDHRRKNRITFYSDLPCQSKGQLHLPSTLTGIEGAQNSVSANTAGIAGTV